jgi:hypothetical protein
MSIKLPLDYIDQLLGEIVPVYSEIHTKAVTTCGRKYVVFPD